MHLLDLVAQIEHIRVIERHMMPIASKNDQVVLEDDTSMTISSRRALPFHVENLGISGLVTTHHGTAI